MTTKALQCLNCSTVTSKGYLCMCGNCKNCGIETPYMAFEYCGPCSVKLDSCFECGQPIKDGTAYLDVLDKAIEKCRNTIKYSEEKLSSAKAAADQEQIEDWEDNLKRWKERNELYLELRQKLPTLTATELISELKARI